MSGEDTGHDNHFSTNAIGGNPEIVYDCNGKVAGRRRVLLWSQPVT